MNHLKSLLLLTISLRLHAAYGDTNSNCVTVAEEGQPQSFRFTSEIGQTWKNYEWTIKIKESSVVVARYEEYNKKIVTRPGFRAFSQQSTYAAGWPVEDMYLYVAAVNRSMTSVQCTNLDRTYPLTQVYGFCHLIIFARPTMPVCDTPRLGLDGRFMEIQCHTYVFPRGLCSFTYYGETKAGPLDSYTVSYEHEYVYANDMYKTTCTLMVPVTDVQWNTNVTAVVSAAPNITNYQNYTVSSKVTASLWIVRPTIISCEVTLFNIDARFFEVSCHAYVIPWGICKFADEKNARLRVEGLKVKYDHKYAADLHKTTCTLIVPVPEIPLPNTNLTFVLSVAPDITERQGYTVSSTWNIPLWTDAPVLTTFTANKRTGTVHYNELDNIKFNCNAAGTPTPRLSLLDAKGVALYVSDVPGALDYTIYNITCGRSEAYTCVAMSVLNSSDQIKSVGSCPSSSSSSSSSSVPVLDIALAVVGAVATIVGIIVVVRSCKRRISSSNRQRRRLANFEGPNEYSQPVHETNTSSGLNQQITRGGNITSRAQNGNRGALFIILSASSRTPGMAFEQNRSTTINGQEPLTRVHTTAVSPPPYDVPSNPPPEYMEILSHPAKQFLYGDNPPGYTLAGSMEA
ncbi:unnamed protein product [Lymnaea stagnalis]|uniref:Uncharacterized protein n=1 Tax=Lymnaea stagnalis TaxID=6523 RepID=A0AAV2HMR6_LYMST